MYNYHPRNYESSNTFLKKSRLRDKKCEKLRTINTVGGKLITFRLQVEFVYYLEVYKDF